MVLETPENGREVIQTTARIPEGLRLLSEQPLSSTGTTIFVLGDEKHQALLHANNASEVTAIRACFTSRSAFAKAAAARRREVDYVPADHDLMPVA